LFHFGSKTPSYTQNFGLWKFFKEIGNSIGSFMEVDMSFMVTSIMTIGKIMVSLYLREGFIEEVII